MSPALTLGVEAAIVAVATSVTAVVTLRRFYTRNLKREFVRQLWLEYHGYIPEEYRVKRWSLRFGAK